MVVLVGLAATGCKDDRPEFSNRTLAGTVERIDVKASRVVISYYSEKHDKRVTAEAQVTPETEIFINGELAKLTDVRIGERATGEVVISREGDRRVIRVRRVDIERAEVITPGKPADGPAPNPEASGT